MASEIIGQQRVSTIYACEVDFIEETQVTIQARTSQDMMLYHPDRHLQRHIPEAPA